MIVGREPHHLSGFLGGEGDYKTEIGMPLYLKNILIDDLPPEVKLLGSFGMSPQLGPREIPWEDDSVKIVPSRTDCSNTSRRQSGACDLVIKVRGYNGINKIDFGQNPDLASRRLPVIDDDRTEFKPRAIFVALPITGSSLNGQVRAQLSLSGPLLVNAAQNQSESNGSEQNSGGGRNQSVVRISKTFGASNVRTDDSFDGVILIFAILLSGMSIAVVYAVLK